MISSVSEIGAVGHRVLHGGDKFTASCIVDQRLRRGHRGMHSPRARCTTPPTLSGIRACQAVMPDTPMVAVFDTAFHQTMPAKAYPLRRAL